MSETATKPRIDNPFEAGMQFEQSPQPQRDMIPVGAGAATDRASAALVTAQRVAIKRNTPALLAEAKALAAAAGDKFYYSMPFKEKDKDGNERIVLVEGPTIGCAMAALSCYGNAAVEAFPAADTQTHWTFMARFSDCEKGVTVIRSFQQRKNQNVGGRMDRGRAEDIVFQIGQSKAIRNVIIGGLKWLTDEMFAAAKSGLLQRIGKAPDKAREYLVGRLAGNDVPLIRVERVIGRKSDQWTVRDMARIFSEIQAIEDGFADAEDLYPASQTEADQMREDVEQQQKNETDKQAAQQQTEGKQEGGEQQRKPRQRQTKPPAANNASVEAQQQAGIANEEPQQTAGQAASAQETEQETSGEGDEGTEGDGEEEAEEETSSPSAGQSDLEFK